MFNKPHDLAIMIAIFGLVMVTVGFGIQGINEQGGSVNASYFTLVESNLNSSAGLKGVGDTSSEALSAEQGASSEEDEENILVSGFRSLLGLGKTWTIVRSSLDEGLSALGIDPIYLMIISSTIIIILFVLIYTWLRGS